MYYSTQPTQYSQLNNPNTDTVVLEISTNLLHNNQILRYTTVKELLEELLPFVTYVRVEGLDNPSWLSEVALYIEELVTISTGDEIPALVLDNLIDYIYTFMYDLIYLLAFSGVFALDDGYSEYYLIEHDSERRVARIGISRVRASSSS